MDYKTYNKLSKEDKKNVPFKEVPVANKISGIALLVLGVIIIIFMIRGCNSCSKHVSNSPPDETSLKMMAKDISENVVKQLLKAPATASFSDKPNVQLLMKDSLAKVNGFVDSQNSFGAMLRSNYMVVLRWSGNRDDIYDPKKWKVVDAQLYK